MFDDSCTEICNSKSLADIATGGKNRELRINYNKHNLFHQSKLGRYVELQNMQIVPFISPHDLMQVRTFRALLGLRLELSDLCRDATSVL